MIHILLIAHTRILPTNAKTLHFLLELRCSQRWPCSCWPPCPPGDTLPSFFLSPCLILPLTWAGLIKALLIFITSIFLEYPWGSCAPNRSRSPSHPWLHWEMRSSVLDYCLQQAFVHINLSLKGFPWSSSQILTPSCFVFAHRNCGKAPPPSPPSHVTGTRRVFHCDESSLGQDLCFLTHCPILPLWQLPE